MLRDNFTLLRVAALILFQHEANAFDFLERLYFDVDIDGQKSNLNSFREEYDDGSCVEMQNKNAFYTEIISRTKHV